MDNIHTTLVLVRARLCLLLQLRAKLFRLHEREEVQSLVHLPQLPKVELLRLLAERPLVYHLLRQRTPHTIRERLDKRCRGRIE
jgi:hypothetical protein